MALARFLTWVILSVPALLHADSGRLTIAVTDLSAVGIDSSEARILSDRLRHELGQTYRFVVVERNRMYEILQEQGFQNSDCSSQECAVEMGRLVGVDRMALGSIGKLGNTYMLTLRIIDVGTGQVLLAAEENTPGSIETVLRSGIRRAARRIAGLDVEEAVEPPAPDSPVRDAPARYGTVLEVFSRFADADIYVGDKKRGTGSIRVAELAPGEYVAVARKKGYEDQKEEFDIDEGEHQRVEFDFKNPHSRGLGFLIPGGICLGLGVCSFALVPTYANSPVGDSNDKTMVAAGVTYLCLGGTLFTIGMLKLHRRRVWDRQHPLSLESIRVGPGAVALDIQFGSR